jgi:hypothetical protein
MVDMFWSVVDHGLNFGKVKQQTIILVFVTSMPCMHYKPGLVVSIMCIS